MALDLLYKSKYNAAERETLVRDLSGFLGKKKVSGKKADRLAVSHGFWLIAENLMIEEKVPSLPDAVVWPETTEDVAELLRFADEQGVPVYPYGGGSGVLGGAVARTGGISLDLKRMNKILDFDGGNCRVRVQGGMNGKNFEDALNMRGYTCGNIPQSLYCSTVGGWAATKATGQFSTKYGGVEDMLLGLEAVLPGGEIFRGEFSPRRSAGPEVFPLFIGSEGTLGVITETVYRIFPLPEKQVFLSFLFSTLGDALKAVKGIIKKDVRPAVVRIYDKPETKRHFHRELGNAQGVALVLIVEGNTELSETAADICRNICSGGGGRELGEEPVKHWLASRFDVSITSKYPFYGFVFDTIEASVEWERADEFYARAVEAMKGIDGVVMATGHASHFYPQGVCFYFTFGGIPRRGESSLELYEAAWTAAVESFIASGGHISHHHGIGINRAPWFARERRGEYALLKKLKKSIDPRNIMNPGLFRMEEE